MIDPNGENINFLTRNIGGTTNSSLTINNARKSFTGYFWIEAESLTFCNASLIVLTSTYVCTCMCTYVTYIYKCIHTYVCKCIHKTLHNYVDAVPFWNSFMNFSEYY